MMMDVLIFCVNWAPNTTILAKLAGQSVWERGIATEGFQKICDVAFINALDSFRWIFHVTFSHCMYTIACMDKFHQFIFSINCVSERFGLVPIDGTLLCWEYIVQNFTHFQATTRTNSSLTEIDRDKTATPPLLNKYILLQMYFTNEFKSISLIQEMNNLICRRKS